MELNQDTSTERTVPPPTETTRERERPSVRDELRRSFAEARRDDETRETREPEVEEEPVVEEAAETETPAEAEPTERTTEARGAGEREDTEVEPSTKRETQTAPAAWSKEAKAAFTHLPEHVKRAVVKREADVEKGIKNLKDSYKEIDEALAPYVPMIRQFQKTPGQAVAQLFSWFDALAKNPDEAFPALIKSYKYNPDAMLAKYGYVRKQQPQQQQQPNGQVQNGQVQPDGQAQPGQQPDVPIPPSVQQYITRLEQRQNQLEQQVGQQFNSLGQYYQEQNAAKTQEMLEQWARDKPHFDRVRVMMGHLLTPDPNSGQAAVPLRDGKVDLDAAYEAAVYAMPEIRTQILAEQQAQADAARKAKQAAVQKDAQVKADQARRTATSLTSSAPGAEVARGGKTPQKGKSVRESLLEARDELMSR